MGKSKVNCSLLWVSDVTTLKTCRRKEKVSHQLYPVGLIKTSLEVVFKVT